MAVAIFMSTSQLERLRQKDEAEYDEEDVDHWSAGVDDLDER